MRKPEVSARILLGVVTFFVAVLIFACRPGVPTVSAGERPAPIIPAKFGAMNPGEGWGR